LRRGAPSECGPGTSEFPGGVTTELLGVEGDLEEAGVPEMGGVARARERGRGKGGEREGGRSGGGERRGGGAGAREARGLREGERESRGTGGGGAGWGGAVAEEGALAYRSGWEREGLRRGGGWGEVCWGEGGGEASWRSPIREAADGVWFGVEGLDFGVLG